MKEIPCTSACITSNKTETNVVQSAYTILLDTYRILRDDNDKSNSICYEYSNRFKKFVDDFYSVVYGSKFENFLKFTEDD